MVRAAGMSLASGNPEMKAMLIHGSMPPGPIRVSAETRRGSRAATATAMAAPKEWPTRWARAIAGVVDQRADHAGEEGDVAAPDVEARQAAAGKIRGIDPSRRGQRRLRHQPGRVVGGVAGDKHEDAVARTLGHVVDFAAAGEEFGALERAGAVAHAPAPPSSMTPSVAPISTIVVGLGIDPRQRPGDRCLDLEVEFGRADDDDRLAGGDHLADFLQPLDNDALGNFRAERRHHDIDRQIRGPFSQYRHARMSQSRRRLNRRGGADLRQPRRSARLPRCGQAARDILTTLVFGAEPRVAGSGLILHSAK